MLQGNPNGPNHLKLLQVGLRSKRTTVQTIQIVQTVQTVQTIQTVQTVQTIQTVQTVQTIQTVQTVQTIQIVQTALCWLHNFDCFISRDTDKFIHDLSRKRFTVLCGYFQLERKITFSRL